MDANARRRRAAYAMRDEFGKQHVQMLDELVREGLDLATQALAVNSVFPKGR